MNIKYPANVGKTSLDVARINRKRAIEENWAKKGEVERVASNPLKFQLKRRAYGEERKIEYDYGVGMKEEEVLHRVPCLFLRSHVDSTNYLIYFHSNGEDMYTCFDLCDHLRVALQVILGLLVFRSMWL